MRRVEDVGWQPKRQPVARQLIQGPNINNTRPCQPGSRNRPPMTLLLGWHSHFQAQIF
jgi:hypothetical protein